VKLITFLPFTLFKMASFPRLPIAVNLIIAVFLSMSKN
jgi:hypothetical protein